jgi:hypothetical protein
MNGKLLGSLSERDMLDFDVEREGCPVLVFLRAVDRFGPGMEPSRRRIVLMKWTANLCRSMDVRRLDTEQ